MAKRREHTERERIENKMAIVPKETDAFVKWALKFVDVHYINFIPFRGNNETLGICSNCGKISVFKKGSIHPKESINCPVCKATCRIKRQDFIKKNPIEGVWVSKEVILFQKIGNRFVERHFEAQKRIDHNRETSRVVEITRIFYYISGTPNGRYFHLYNPWTGENFWSKSNLSYNPIVPKRGPVYPRTVRKEMFEDTNYKYCAMETLTKMQAEFMPCEWIDKYKEMPHEMEMLAKMGLVRLALSVRKSDLAENGKPWERLGISKEQLNLLIEVKGGWLGLTWLRNAAHKGERIDADTLKYLESQCLLPSDVAFVDGHMSKRQIVNYIKRQRKVTRKGTSEVLRLWNDYLSMAKRAKMDISKELIYKPKDIRQAHDSLVKLIGGKEIAVRAGEIEESYPDIDSILREIREKYSYQNGDYAIVVPEKIEDIIVEGRKLGHCLDKSDIYFDRITRRESYIVFLRRTEDIEKPFYTLEIEPNGTTRQKRTTGDKQDKDFSEAVGFIRKWQRVVKKRLSEEDKALAKESEKLRAQEFKELREKQTKIWHGALAGKLLADVLEADLMIAAG